MLGGCNIHWNVVEIIQLFVETHCSGKKHPMDMNDGMNVWSVLNPWSIRNPLKVALNSEMFALKLYSFQSSVS
jgi:hypothetical protein